jgi:holin-like protein
MIRGLVFILLFQGLGEIISKALALPIPGPVVGLVALLVFLLIRKEIDPDLDMVASAFAQHLGLLFIPAAVGVVMFVPLLASHGAKIALILVVSVGVTVALTSYVLRRFGNHGNGPQSDPHSGRQSARRKNPGTANTKKSGTESGTRK